MVVRMALDKGLRILRRWSLGSAGKLTKKSDFAELVAVMMLTNFFAAIGLGLQSRRQLAVRKLGQMVLISITRGDVPEVRHARHPTIPLPTSALISSSGSRTTTGRT